MSKGEKALGKQNATGGRIIFIYKCRQREVCVCVCVCVSLHIVDFLVAKHKWTTAGASLLLLLFYSLFFCLCSSLHFWCASGMTAGIRIPVQLQLQQCNSNMADILVDLWPWVTPQPHFMHSHSIPHRYGYDFLIFNWTARRETLPNANCALRCSVVRQRICRADRPRSLPEALGTFNLVCYTVLLFS